MQEILTNIKVGTLYMPYSTYEGKQFYIQLEEYIKENNINQQQILNLDGANKMSYRSIFDICSYFFIKISYNLFGKD